VRLAGDRNGGGFDDSVDRIDRLDCHDDHDRAVELAPRARRWIVDIAD